MAAYQDNICPRNPFILQVKFRHGVCCFLECTSKSYNLTEDFLGYSSVSCQEKPWPTNPKVRLSGKGVWRTNYSLCPSGQDFFDDQCNKWKLCEQKQKIQNSMLLFHVSDGRCYAALSIKMVSSMLGTEENVEGDKIQTTNWRSLGLLLVTSQEVQILFLLQWKKSSWKTS